MKYTIFSIILIFGFIEIGCKHREIKTPMSKVDSLSHVLSGDSFQYWIKYPLLKKSIDFQNVDSQMYVALFKFNTDGSFTVHYYYPRTKVANPVDYSYFGGSWKLESEHFLSYYGNSFVYNIFEFKADTLKVFRLCSNDSFLFTKVASPFFFKGSRSHSEYSNGKVNEEINHEWIRKQLK